MYLVPGKNKYMTLKEAAFIAGVSVQTIRRWIKSGKISALQPHGPDGHWWVLRSDVDNGEK